MMRFPVSPLSRCAMISTSRSNNSAIFESRSLRSFQLHELKTLLSKVERAELMASSASSIFPSETIATKVPSAGLRISRVAPSNAGRHFPAI